MVPRSWHTSHTATSAPRRASSTAWERPCPRAPPVITATRPSNGVPSPAVIDPVMVSPSSPAGGRGRGRGPLILGSGTWSTHDAGASLGAAPGPQDLAVLAVPPVVPLAQGGARPSVGQERRGQEGVGLQVAEDRRRQHEPRRQVDGLGRGKILHPPPELFRTARPARQVPQGGGQVHRVAGRSGA